MGAAGAIGGSCSVTFCSRQLKGSPSVFDGIDFAPKHPLGARVSVRENVITELLMTVSAIVSACAIVLVLDWAGVRAGCIGGDQPACNVPSLLGP
jgi:hypothetical protein